MAYGIEIHLRHVHGLAEGDVGAFEELLELARRMTSSAARRRGLKSVTAADLPLDAITEAAVGVIQGAISTADDLKRTISRTVWRLVEQEARRERVEINIDPRDLHIVDWEPVDHAAFEARIPRVTIGGPVKQIYKFQRSPIEATRSVANLVVVDDRMIEHFRQHPEEMHRLDSRRFEELVARMLDDLGYDVELTARSADGGVDIIATQHMKEGKILLIADCKRYAEENKVGVALVRGLWAVGDLMKANISLLATTSFFTKPAIEFQEAMGSRLSLRDYNALCGWLDDYGIGQAR